MSIKDTIIPTHLNMLGMLDGLLAKAEADERGDSLLEARLAEDMHPLSTQVRFLCNMPGEAMARLIGIDFASDETDPGTLAVARVRIETTRKQIGEWSEANFVADDAKIELAIPNGMTFDLTAAEYVGDWAVPQYYFHATTAYAILRHAGFAIGKADFVPYMFKYLRAPASS